MRSTYDLAVLRLLDVQLCDSDKEPSACKSELVSGRLLQQESSRGVRRIVLLLTLDDLAGERLDRDPVLLADRLLGGLDLLLCEGRHAAHRVEIRAGAKDLMAVWGAEKALAL